MHDLRQVQPGRRLDQLLELQEVARDGLGQRRRAVRRDDRERVDAGHGRGELLRDLRQGLQQAVEHGRLVELLVRLGPLLQRLGLGLAAGEDRGGLRRTLELGGPRLGRPERQLTGTTELVLGLGRLGGLDGGDALRLGLLLEAVALGVGGAAHGGVQLALGQGGLPLRDELLLREDLLLAGGGLERSGRRRQGLRAVRLGEDLRLPQVERALVVGHLGLGVDPLLLGQPARLGLGDLGLAADRGGRRAAHVEDVRAAAVVADLLDGERVEAQPLRAQRPGDGLEHLLGERLAVPDDLLHGQVADDGAQRTGELVRREAVDLLLLAAEALGGRADGDVLVVHLDDRDAGHVQRDALRRRGAVDLDRDPAGGHVEHRQLLDERQDEHAATGHHLLPRQVVRASCPCGR